MGEERDSKESVRESRNGEGEEGASPERDGGGTSTWCTTHVYVLVFGLLGWVSIFSHVLCTCIYMFGMYIKHMYIVYVVCPTELLYTCLLKLLAYSYDIFKH